MSSLLCCLCGTAIDFNEAYMCLECLRKNNDITNVIPKHVELKQCRKCTRWQLGQNQWALHKAESLSLMNVLLKKVILSVKDTRVIEASYIWTEPHSKRIKIKVEIERSILDSKISLRQVAVVEFVVRNAQCLECIREATDHSWKVCIQIRHRVGHKKSLYQLENVLIKKGLQNLILNVDVAKEGLDLYFKTTAQSDKVMKFITCNLPCKSKSSKKLVSQDKHSNTTKFEYTVQLDICPVCKGDLLFVQGSGSPDLYIVTKMTKSVHLTSPYTLARIELNSVKYFARPPLVMSKVSALTTFVVLDISPLPCKDGSKQGELADVEVARESDMGSNDRSFLTRTHLGRVLQPGDLVQGYDLSSSCIEEEDLASLPYDCPDVVLVRKSFADKEKGRNRKGSGRAAEDAQSIITLAATPPEGTHGVAEERGLEEEEEFALPMEGGDFFDIDDIDKTDDWNEEPAGSSDSEDGELADSSFGGFGEISPSA